MTFYSIKNNQMEPNSSDRRKQNVSNIIDITRFKVCILSKQSAILFLYGVLLHSCV